MSLHSLWQVQDAAKSPCRKARIPKRAAIDPHGW